MPVNAVQGTPVVNVLVASFADPGGPQPVGNYSATIDWGDGTAATPGSVSASGGGFSVLGSHTYSLAGQFGVTVTVRAQDGRTATAATSAAVGMIPPPPPPVGGPNERFVAQAYVDLFRRPVDASRLYARNVSDLLLLMTSGEGEVVPDFDDEVVAGCWVTRDGTVREGVGA